MEIVKATTPKLQTMNHLEKALRFIPGGSQTASKSPSRYVQGPSPLFVKEAEGCRFTDLEGKEYLDFGMALGASILGYRNPYVTDAVINALAYEGELFTLPSYREAQTAEILLSYMPWAEQVRFGKTGTDVTTAAVRVARAYTGRSGIASQGYHGWGDWSVALTPPHAGIPNCEEPDGMNLEVVSLDWLQSDLGWIDIGLAAVIVEVMSDGEEAEDWLQGLRERCDQTGTVLIFDEVLSGFRYQMGSASSVLPDLICFGKSIGNGFSISALAGRKELMQTLEPGGVFFSGTSFGEVTGLAACEATMGVMEREHVPSHLAGLGMDLRDWLNESDGPRWKGTARVVMDGLWSQAKRALFQQECAKRGVLFMGAHNLSWAHRESDVRELVGVYREVWDYMTSLDTDWADALEGPPSNVPYRIQ